MNKKLLFQSTIILVITVMFLSACGGQSAVTPTAEETEAAPAATPTSSPVAGIETPIKIAGAELKITLATTDSTAYDSGPFSVQTDPGTKLIHIEAAVISGSPDFTILNQDVSLVDGKGKDCQLVSFGNEKPLWEFIVPDGEKSFTLTFGDGQTVVLDSIFNKPAATVPTSEPAKTPTATIIPPTPEPTILIQLGPGKFGKSMWLEVLKGDYQIVGGTTLRTGSSIGVDEDWLKFPSGLAIDVVGTSVTLKGTAYPDGSKLLVDSSGSLVPRGTGGEPAAPAQSAPAETQSYKIPAGTFPMDDMIDCRTDVSISEVTADGFQVNGPTISMHKDRFVIWCPGARHTWVGSLTYEGYSFTSDAADPLVFTLDSEGAYVYAGGRGTITEPGGKKVDLKGGAASAGGGSSSSAPTQAPPAPTPTPEVVWRRDVFPTVFLKEGFNDNAGQWSVGDVDGPWWKGTRLIKDGLLEWNGTSKMGMNSTVSPEKPSMLNYCSNMETSVKVRNLNPAMDGFYGLSLWSTDGGSAYVFAIDPNGNYAFWLINNEEWVPLIDWTASPFVKANEWNRLTIQAQNGNMKLFINDKLAGEVADKTISVFAGYLIVETYSESVNIQVQFDDYEIRLPATEKEAGCPLTLSAAPDARFSQTLVSDSFDNASKGWPVGRVTTVYWKGDRIISNGVYDIKGVSASEMYSYAYTENGSAWDKYISDQRASVKVKLAKSPLEGAVGLTVRLDDSGSSNNFYTFIISSDGNASFYKVYNDEWTPLMDWTQINGLSPDQWTTLAIEAFGSHFRLFINDELVGEADDSTLKEGRTALYVETYKSSVSFDVQFDNFEIMVPK